MARRSWLALLPASKGTADGGDGPPWRTASTPRAGRVTRALLSAAADSDDDDLCRLVQAPASQASAVRALTRALPTAPTRPAWQRYTGVVHATADPDSLDATAHRRFRRHVAYVSALAGLVTADEPLPAYRLPMAASLDDLGSLASWWREPITARLADLLAPGARLWLLTGGEYGRAVVAPDGVATVDPVFVERRGGADRTPPAAALKQARGHLARLLATEPALGRRPDAPAWDAVSFVAGARTFRLEGADACRQVWRATPVAAAS